MCMCEHLYYIQVINCVRALKHMHTNLSAIFNQRNVSVTIVCWLLHWSIITWTQTNHNKHNATHTWLSTPNTVETVKRI